jgi:hypothetical protein
MLQIEGYLTIVNHGSRSITIIILFTILSWFCRSIDNRNVFVTMTNVRKGSTYKIDIDSCDKFNKPFKRVAYSLTAK